MASYPCRYEERVIEKKNAESAIYRRSAFTECPISFLTSLPPSARKTRGRLSILVISRKPHHTSCRKGMKYLGKDLVSYRCCTTNARRQVFNKTVKISGSWVFFLNRWQKWARSCQISARHQVLWYLRSHVALQRDPAPRSEIGFCPEIHRGSEKRSMWLCD